MIFSTRSNNHPHILRVDLEIQDGRADFSLMDGRADDTREMETTRIGDEMRDDD